MKTSIYLIAAFTTLLILAGCGEGSSTGTVTSGDYVENPSPQETGNNSSDWLIPKDEVFNGGVGMDGIPALTEPPMISSADADYNLHVAELVVGVAVGDEAHAYPHNILDWHEIINDTIDGTAFAVTYCPLTGSAIGLNRRLSGDATTFGVSGLLYNSNLMPYDRETRSYWSQMKLQSVTGPLAGEDFAYIPVVETTWETWKELYPETKAVSEQTGHNRSYGSYPYGSYRTSGSLIFPVDNEDNRFHKKARVHGIQVGNSAIAFSIELFPFELTAINHSFAGTDIVTVGSSDKNLAVSYGRDHEGRTLRFDVVRGNPPIVMIDRETGSEWDVFGRSIGGELNGSQLEPVVSYIAYWFAWAAFHPETAVYPQ